MIRNLEPEGCGSGNPLLSFDSALYSLQRSHSRIRAPRHPNEGRTPSHSSQLGCFTLDTSLVYSVHRYYDYVSRRNRKLEQPKNAVGPDLAECPSKTACPTGCTRNNGSNTKFKRRKNATFTQSVDCRGRPRTLRGECAACQGTD